LLYDRYLVKLEASHDVMLTGRTFMISVLSLVFVLGVEGAAFGQLLELDYFNGVYFAVVSMLTVGRRSRMPSSWSQPRT
jgi:hypothetical protein